MGVRPGPVVPTTSSRSAFHISSKVLYGRSARIPITTPSAPEEPSHSNFRTSKRTASTLDSWAMPTFGLAARRVRPSGFATLNTWLVATRWAAPVMFCTITVGLAGMCLPRWRATIRGPTLRLPPVAPITTVIVLPS